MQIEQIENLGRVLGIVNNLEARFKSEPRLFFNLSLEHKEKLESLSFEEKIFWIIKNGNVSYVTEEQLENGRSKLQCTAGRHRSTGDLYRILIGMGIDISLEYFIYQLCRLREDQKLFTIHCPDARKRVWDTNIKELESIYDLSEFRNGRAKQTDNLLFDDLYLIYEYKKTNTKETVEH